MRRDELVEVGTFAFELPAEGRTGMRVPARVYADETLLSAILEGEAMAQLANVATLPGVVDRVYGMPDMHEGYGFPVGGVAATLLPDGVVSPGGVGFDINCGVRLLALPLSHAELGARLEPFVHELSRSIPSGMGHGSQWSLTDAELEGVLTDGSAYLVTGSRSRLRWRHCQHGIGRLSRWRRPGQGLAARQGPRSESARLDGRGESFRRGAGRRARGGCCGGFGVWFGC